MAAIGTLCGASALAGVLAHVVRGRSSQMFGASVYRGTSTRRAVALTFDDGPSESTPRLLNALAKNGVPATFFQCGANIRRLPGAAREVVRAGHEIGNHSDTHPALYFKSAATIHDEFETAQSTIEQTLQVTPRFLRAPFGVRWLGFAAMQRRLKLLGVMWTVIGCDWRLGAEQVVRRVSERVGNGAIVCLHDGRELTRNPDIRATVEAVSRIVPILAGRGYSFETVSQILCPTK